MELSLAKRFALAQRKSDRRELQLSSNQQPSESRYQARAYRRDGI